jgi:hypothetical protein
MAFRDYLINVRQGLRVAEAAGAGSMYRTIRQEHIVAMMNEWKMSPVLEPSFYGQAAGTLKNIKEFVIDPNFLSTDGLLILLMCSASALGSVVSGLRTKSPTSIKDLSLGLASGFIIYLGVRGGKFLLINPVAGSSIALNPSGLAFVAVLVGLYTERAYQFLSRLLDRFENAMLAPGGASTGSGASGQSAGGANANGSGNSGSGYAGRTPAAPAPAAPAPAPATPTADTNGSQTS